MLGKRQTQGEDGALTGCADESDVAAMSLYDAFHRKETNTCAGNVNSCGHSALEAVEETVLGLGGDAETVVNDPDLGLPWLSPDFDHHSASIGPVLDGIVHQVTERSAEVAWVGTDPQPLRGGLHLNGV